MNDGKNFERLVGDVLRLKGYNVEVEQLVLTKRVDLLISELRWGRPWRIAVECKDEGKPLTKNRLATLWAEYQAIYDANLVNEILVVTRVAPSPTALAWAAQRNGLSTQTLDELGRQILDTTEYLKMVAGAFDRTELAAYYQEPTTVSGEHLSPMIDSWIEERSDGPLDNTRPIAILGAYGIGKSSFALHLASRLAAKALMDPTARIPILIPLGDLAREQTLQGLLGAHLASTYEIPGYSFTRFMTMNRNGRFVILLDGFDEMKHLISWSEFIYNLNQLYELVDGDARVILLGRPTAFESDTEQEEALSQGHVLHGSEFKARNFQSVEIAPLGAPQIQSFISRFGAKLELSDGEIEKIRYIVKLPQFQDIAKRPVQLWMLAIIIPGYSGNLDRLDLPGLYESVISELINNVIGRETSKGSRRGFDARVRRKFLQDLAYWMWTVPGGYVTTSDQISDDLVAPYVSSHRELPHVRRELVMGAPLDRRLGDKLKFPHRSFQEYLVAVECLDRISRKSLSIDEYDQLTTDEVANFVRSLRTRDNITAARASLATKRGGVSWRTAHSLLLADEVPVEIQATAGNEGNLILWNLLLSNAKAVESSQQHVPDEVTIRDALRVSGAENHEVPLLAMFIVLAGSGGRQLAGRPLKLLEEIIEALIRRGRLEGFSRASLNAMGEQRIISQRQHRHGGARRPGASYDSWSADFSTVGGGLSLAPIDEDFVGDLRDGSRRLGVRVSGGRLIRPSEGSTRLDIAGRTNLNLRWLSDAAISVCRAVSTGGSFDGRSAVSPLLKALQSAAFISSWSSTYGFSPSIKLAPPVVLNPELTDEMSRIQLAYKKYQEGWPDPRRLVQDNL